MDMNVNTNCGQIEADGYREIGCFSSDTRKLAKILHGIRENSTELFLKHLRELL